MNASARPSPPIGVREGGQGSRPLGDACASGNVDPRNGANESEIAQATTMPALPADLTPPETAPDAVPVVVADSRSSSDPDNSSKSEQMRALFAAGMSIREVAKTVGVRYSFAYGVAKRAGFADTAATRREPGRPQD